MIQDIVVQTDGTIWVGFGTLPQSGFAGTRDGLIKLNSNGSFASGFDWHDPQGSRPIKQVIPLPSGSILALNPYQLYRVMPNGSLDPAFPMVSADSFSAMARQPDGRILLSGDFHSINRIPAEGFARLNADGNFDFSFQAHGGPDFAIAVQADGKILAAAFGGVRRMLPNGTLDKSFVRPMATESIHGFALDSNERIFVSVGSTVYEYSGHFRVMAPATSVNAVLERSGLIDSGWVPVQSIPANTKLDFFDSIFPGTQNVFYRARQIQ